MPCSSPSVAQLTRAHPLRAVPQPHAAHLRLPSSSATPKFYALFVVVMPKQNIEHGAIVRLDEDNEIYTSSPSTSILGSRRRARNNVLGERGRV